MALFKNQAFNYLPALLNTMKDDKLTCDIFKGYLDGGRKSGKTTSVIQFSILAVLMFPNACDVEAFRWLKGQDCDELFAEFIQNTEIILKRNLTKREVNYSKHTIYLNGNTIKVRGINSAYLRKQVKLVGTQRKQGKRFLVKIFEERYEFIKDEIIAINHALGGYDKIIEFSITNPHSLAYDYISDLDNRFPHLLSELKTKGQQFHFQHTTNQIWELFHYTNWRVNKFLSQADILDLQETHKLSKAKAYVADYGMPGVEAGAIYAEEMNKLPDMTRADIIKKFGHEITELSVGIDLGHGDKETSSATTSHLLARTKDDKWLVLYEYYHHNKNGYSPLKIQAREMVNMILNSAKDYEIIRNLINQQGLKLNCEWDFAFMEILQTEITKRNLDKFFEIKKATKHSELARIEIRKFQMGRNKYFVAKECVEHIKELQVQKWDDTRKDRETKRHLPQDAFNHTTDDGDYATAQWAYEIFSNEQFKLLNKNVKLNYGSIR